MVVSAISRARFPFPRSRSGSRSAAHPVAVLLAAALVLVTFHGQAAQAKVAAWMVFEANSGKVIEQHDAFRRWYPASLTKLMTAYVTFTAIREGRITMASPVTMSAHAAAQPPSKMGLKPGTQLSLDAALKVMLVKSANDIAVAIAETVGGSEGGFADVMNQTARRLGMRDTHFVNPHGLPDPNHYSSVRDMAVLARALLRDFPQYRELYGYAGVQFGKHLLRSANREYLQRVRGADGLKTGYICNSGYNVAVSATRGGRTVVAIVFGAASGLERAAMSRQLIEKGFEGGGLFSRRKTLDEMARPRIVKGLPPDGYCKRNKKPDVAELLKTYAGGRTTGVMAALTGNPNLPGVANAYAGDSGRVPPRVPGAIRSAKKNTTVPRTGDKKVDWGEVMDRLIGSRRNSGDLVRVTLAVDPDAKAAVPLRAPKAQDPSETVAEAFGVVMPPRSKPDENIAAAAGGAPAATGRPLVIIPLPSRAADGTPTPRRAPR
ncbi:D-alanyl-D-alanine carboxypeptidase family protein [Breoghania sp. JC706]|uniref:D-alanyl-D-alanine carboxypeptidase family protein n=1 Tax=Breoghania sp. JC706 TaxID=3117732 RepID=UPI00300AA6EF